MNAAAPSPEEVRLWLEWAGKALLALPARGLYPAQIKALDLGVAPDASLAYGYNQTRLRPAAPSAEEIEWIDEILSLPNVCHLPLMRRILQARALVKPLNGRYLYSWALLSRKLHLDPQTIRALHNRGLVEIIRETEQSKVCRISTFAQKARISA